MTAPFQIPREEFPRALRRATEIANELATRAMETQRLVDVAGRLDVDWIAGTGGVLEELATLDPYVRTLVVSVLTTTVAMLAKACHEATGVGLEEIARRCAARGIELVEQVDRLFEEQDRFR